MFNAVINDAMSPGAFNLPATISAAAMFLEN